MRVYVLKVNRLYSSDIIGVCSSYKRALEIMRGFIKADDDDVDEENIDKVIEFISEYCEWGDYFIEEFELDKCGIATSSSKDNIFYKLGGIE